MFDLVRNSSLIWCSGGRNCRKSPKWSLSLFFGLRQETGAGERSVWSGKGSYGVLSCASREGLEVSGEGRSRRSCRNDAVGTWGATLNEKICDGAVTRETRGNLVPGVDTSVSPGGCKVVYHPVPLIVPVSLLGWSSFCPSFYPFFFVLFDRLQVWSVCVVSVGAVGDALP